VIKAFIMIILGAVFSFILFRILPGDPAKALTGDPRLPLETKKVVFKMFGLDRPLHEQLFIFICNLLTGNLGISFQYKLPVSQILMEKLTNTLILLIPATVLSMLLGIFMGLIAGLFNGKLIDKIITSIATLFWSTPSFWGGMVAITIFAINMRLFPPGGMLSFYGASPSLSNIGDLLWHLFLPMLTYGIIFSGQYTLILRNSLVEVLTEDFIKMAKAKGHTDFEVVMKYALRNASLGLVSMIGINVGYILLGSITIESVFNWPGIGRLLYDAVFYNDYPLLQGIFILFIIVMVASMLVVDILYSYLDPRVRIK